MNKNNSTNTSKSTYPFAHILGIFVLQIIISLNAISQNCKPLAVPDLPLIASSQAIEAEINSIFATYKTADIGTSRPTAAALTNADNAYNALNIIITNGVISGNQINSTYNQITFLRDYAKEFMNGALSQNRKEYALNTIWLVCKQICDGSVIGTSYDAPELYNFDTFSKPAIYFYSELNPTQQELFAAAMERYGAFEHFWSPVYDSDYMAQNDGVDTDQMYNNSKVLLAFCAKQSTAEERYRWMRGYKRWVERFTTYSNTTCNGIKRDGTGFHHWTAYDNYMYAFKSCCDVIYFTSGTSFQINTTNYLSFRDAVFAQIVFSNKQALKPLSMSGRKPHDRTSQYSRDNLKRLAIAGGRILGLPTSDPELAGQYIRIFGPDATLGYTSAASESRTDGFYQFNYANMGIFRKNGWLAGMKGFTDGLWGAELYETSNRYGRYQSYGTMEIIYEGNGQYGNGFHVNGWNWNYNPGATTRVLSWYDMNGEKARIDEYQAKPFAGALAFNNFNNATLNRTHGAIGMFAMDFQEVEGQGFSTTFHANTHDASFKFKKSTFVFDDLIVCLGSNISSTKTAPVVTTLFQRLNNKSSVIANNVVVSTNATTNLSGTNPNWIISNYGTGFYMPYNNISITNINDKTPYHDENDPNTQISNNTSYDKWIGYINHGIQPSNANYEYIVKPNTNSTEMEALHQTIMSGSKPYTIIKQDATAHIIKHLASDVLGYAIFGKNVTLNNTGLIEYISDSCMIMYKNTGNSLKIALSNPLFGFGKRSYNKELAKTITVKIKGKWLLSNTVNGVSIAEKTETHTVFSVFTEYGYPYEFDLILDTPTSVIELDNQPSIKICPNPFTSTLQINATGYNHLVLYDISGRILISEEIKSNAEIQLNPSYSEVPAGLYFLKLTSSKMDKTIKILRK